MKKVWYLLKNRRYEGPFHVEDLNVKAQQGLLSPDDYLITEEEFTKGQMSYKRASDLLHRDCFAKRLSVPEMTLSQKNPITPSENTSEKYDSISGQESYKTAKTSKTNFEESVSPLSEWLSQINFANAATTCVIVLAAVWFFDSNNKRSLERQPADVTSSSGLQKRTVEREVVQKDYRKSSQKDSPRVERLMPSERPRSAVVASPSFQGNIQEDFVEPQLANDNPPAARSNSRGRSRAPVREEFGSGYDNSPEDGAKRDVAGENALPNFNENENEDQNLDIQNQIHDSQILNGEDNEYGDEPLIDPMGESPEEVIEDNSY